MIMFGDAPKEKQKDKTFICFVVKMLKLEQMAIPLTK